MTGLEWLRYLNKRFCEGNDATKRRFAKRIDATLINDIVSRIERVVLAPFNQLHLHGPDFRAWGAMFEPKSNFGKIL